MIRKRLYTFLIIGTVMAVGGFFIFRTHGDLTGLTIFEGPLHSIRVVKIQDDYHANEYYPALTFAVGGLDKKFALRDNNPAQYDYYQSLMKTGDSVRIYYDPHEGDSDQGYSLSVSEVDKLNGTKIVDIERANESNRQAGIAFLTIGSLLVIGGTGYYFSSKNKEVRNAAS